MKLIIKGNKQYIKNLEKHLNKEHPKTKGHTQVKK